MKKKLNLYMSIFTLSVTLCLLIMTVFSWYVTNKNVFATGIFGSSESDDFSLKLQKGTYTDSTWDWVDSNSISLTNINPGDTFFFRIKFETTNTNSFLFELKDISSELQTTKLVVDNEYICFKATNNIPLYKLIDNKFKIGEDILYSYDTTNEIISLGSTFYIENTFLVYNLGLNSDTPDFTDDLSQIEKDKVKALNESFLIENVSETKYFYFALEFNEELSLKTIDGIQCSNAYLYQKLTIGNISIQKQ